MQDRSLPVHLQLTLYKSSSMFHTFPESGSLFSCFPFQKQLQFLFVVLPSAHPLLGSPKGSFFLSSRPVRSHQLPSNETNTTWPKSRLWPLMSLAMATIARKGMRQLAEKSELSTYAFFSRMLLLALKRHCPHLIHRAR